MVFLILTKILSKSAKSLQEDWNMCMNWFTHRFSMLERRGTECKPRQTMSLLIITDLIFPRLGSPEMEMAFL